MSEHQTRPFQICKQSTLPPRCIHASQMTAHSSDASQASPESGCQQRRRCRHQSGSLRETADMHVCGWNLVAIGSRVFKHAVCMLASALHGMRAPCATEAIKLKQSQPEVCKVEATVKAWNNCGDALSVAKVLVTGVICTRLCLNKQRSTWGTMIIHNLPPGRALATLLPVLLSAPSRLKKAKRCSTDCPVWRQSPRKMAT